MVSAPKIRCVVMLAPSENDVMTSRYTPRFRPSDLLPWADPHIRSLVEQLQDEVREEEEARRHDVATLADESGGVWSYDTDEQMAGLSGRF